jgi:hypothetical protein
MMTEEQGDVFLGFDDFVFLIIRKLFSRCWRCFGLVFKFTDDLIERILTRWIVALRPNPNLRRSVSAQHIPILNQRDFRPHPRRGNRRTESTVTATNDDEIILASVFDRARNTGDFPSGALFKGRIRRRGEIFIVAEKHGIRASVETGQVFQRHF